MKVDLLRSSTALNYKFGLIAKVLFRELLNRLVRFNELLLLAPNSFEGGVETKLEVIERKLRSRWRSLSDRRNSRYFIWKMGIIEMKDPFL